MNWTLKLNGQKFEYNTFPNAFRTMHNMVEQNKKGKKPVDTKSITILGPKDPRGDRNTYSFATAVQMARDQGLLLPDGLLNKREFQF